MLLLLLLLALIFVPVISFTIAQKKYPGHLWAITGATFGVVVYPFLTAMAISLMYGGALGHAIFQITTLFTSIHGLPGKVLFHLINGLAPSYPGNVDVWLFALNAVVWCVVYGVIGRYIDQGKSKKVIKLLLVLCCIPPIAWLLANFNGVISLLDEVVDGNSYSLICRQVVGADENAEVWMRIGNLRSSASEKAVAGKQLCSKVNVTKRPFQVLLGDIQHPSIALNIPVVGGKKTCIGLTPNYPDASSQSADWTAKVIDCPSEK